MKFCNKCKEEKELNEYYFDIKKRANGDEYTYYRTYCKECYKDAANKWKRENPEARAVIQKRSNDLPHRKEIVREMNKIARDEGRYREWQRVNKNKTKGYRENRVQNKAHDIAECEWEECKDFFDYSCAYCGMDEYFAKEIYKQQLHKEHVEHDGVNDITNCVPSCKSCNGSKWELDLNDWYNSDNEIYSEDRYKRIIEWLLSFQERKEA